MKTEQLITLLAQGAGPAPRGVVLQRLAPRALAGGLAALVLAVLALGCVPPEMFLTPAPWVKLAYALALALAAGWLTARLARPVARLAMPVRAVAAVAMAMALLGGWAWNVTPALERPAALMGHSSLVCPLFVLALSLPALAAVLWAVRGLAPTRPRAAGAAAGLLAGALGAAAYALVCTETSTVFVAVWYSVGMLLTVALGAALGPRVLRW